MFNATMTLMTETTKSVVKVGAGVASVISQLFSW